MSERQYEPCPFCGATARQWTCRKGRVTGTRLRWRTLRLIDDDEGSWSMCCYRCRCTGPQRDTRREAVEAWNAQATKAVVPPDFVRKLDYVSKHDVWEACVKALCPKCLKGTHVKRLEGKSVWRHPDGILCRASALFQLRERGLP